MSKIIRIFLNFFFIEEYQFRGTFFVIDIFWKLQFLKHLKHFLLKLCLFFVSWFWSFGSGKSLSEALIFASINPQYDNRLFMELPWKLLQAQNMDRTWVKLLTKIYLYEDWGHLKVFVQIFLVLKVTDSLIFVDTNFQNSAPTFLLKHL